MTLADVDIAPYEGLIFSTARRYEGLVDHDLEDIQQMLRLKVAQALVAYDSSRTTVKIENWVFSCVRNRVKDMLKGQSRLNHSRGGAQLYIEDQAPTFESDRMCVGAEQVFADVDDADLALPSTITSFERRVIRCWLLDEEMSQADIARRLRVSRQLVREAQAAIREKMADWAPATGELPSALQLAA